MGGVPKAGTTSLYKYLLQHPEVTPAADKELTFWGNFFTPKRRPGREEGIRQLGHGVFVGRDPTCQSAYYCSVAVWAAVITKDRSTKDRSYHGRDDRL